MGGSVNLTNNPILDLVIQHLPSNKKTNPSGGWSICCPMCMSRGESRNDTKFRGGLTPQADGSFVYHCFNCKFATRHEKDGRVGKNLMKFLVALGIDSRQIPLGLRLLRKDEKMAAKIVPNDRDDVALEFNVERLPYGSRKVTDWLNEDPIPELLLEALDYLASRGNPVFEGWTYFWTNSKNYSMDERVIIPFYHHGKIVGYTARTFTDNKKLSKYYAKTQADYMFNQDKLEGDSEIIFLMEGVFDAISIKGIASMGNMLTDKQINLLNKSNKEIIVVPDRSRTGSALVEQAIEQKWKVSIPQWDFGNIDDVANATKEYGRLYTVDSILKSVLTNPETIRMRFNTIRLTRG